MHTIYYNSPIKQLEITGNENSIIKIKFIDDEVISPKKDFNEILLLAYSQIEEYFNGKRKNFSFKMQPEGTEFQKKVWNEMKNIPFGTTISYKELAIRIGNPKAVRAVANANANNPLPIVVPCHRVIGSNGKLTGFRGGLWRKKYLIEMEKQGKKIANYELQIVNSINLINT